MRASKSDAISLLLQSDARAEQATGHRFDCLANDAVNRSVGEAQDAIRSAISDWPI
jgi:hypothetical protein